MIKHEMAAGALMRLLAQVDPDVMVSPNAVGNLRLFKDNAYIGYIDLGYEQSLELTDEPWPGK